MPHKRNKVKFKTCFMKNEEGVAAVVGTIMALMVFLAFLSLFTTQYIPVWMADNEASHMNEVETELGAFKQGVDNRIAANDLNIKVYTAIKLGSKGVPVFASETAGQISLYAIQNTFSVDYGIIDPKHDVRTNATGNVRFYAPNRYYVQQRIIYENDAIIVNQTDGELIKTPPQFSISVSKSGLRNITFTLVSLIGVNSSVAGVGMESLNAKLLLKDSNRGFTNDLGRTVWINITTKYYYAWREWFMTTLQNASLVYGTDFTISTPTYTPLGDGSGIYSFSIKIEDINNLSLTQANIKTWIGNTEPSYPS